MTDKKSYVVVVGARPNFVKAAPLLKRSKEYPQLEFTLVHTGQHFDSNMSDIFFDQMNIPRPDIHLEINGNQHSEKIGKTVSALKDVLLQGSYDGVIVFGDINSTLSAALAASSLGKKLVHIESGLRSYDKRMPEELNRVVTDHLSDFLFVTEQSGLDNLCSEGVAPENIHLVGNIMIESIELFRDKFDKSKILEDLELSEKDYVVATIHRFENTSDYQILKKLLETLESINKSIPLVFPLHPSARYSIEKYGLSNHLSDIKIVDPLGYFDFMKLVMGAKGVVTDSGGIQEETSYLGVPCCTLRDNTERPITIELGSNMLCPIETIDYKKILEHFFQSKNEPHGIPLWDAEVSKRILDVIVTL
jgi:UDP-N-acetylglucosamine 2-epimerase (non-hydrolysing)